MGMDSIGAFLRRERELRQVSLEELVQTTRVPLRMLQRIEEDRFEELPGDVFARGFLRSYARALNLDADRVLARFAEGRKPEAKTPPPLLATLQTPERGRRFGIAIALVILGILFTLALSIVFNARHRSTPLELSVFQPARQDSCTLVPVCAPSMSAAAVGDGLGIAAHVSLHRAV
jgi:cytoskeletal protein RodZ